MNFYFFFEVVSEINEKVNKNREGKTNNSYILRDGIQEDRVDKIFFDERNKVSEENYPCSLHYIFYHF